jgi:hypothetical protein
MQDHELVLRQYPSLLLGDRLNPITNNFAFLELEHDAALDAFLRWQHERAAPELVTDHLNAAAQRLGPVGDRARNALRDLANSRTSIYAPRREIGDLEQLLRRLLPLANFAYRYAVVPTASRWTAFFDNGRMGPDLNSAMFALSRREGCRNLLITANPDEIDGRRRPTLWLGGEMKFELRGPNAGVVNDPTDRRGLRAGVADAGRWVWEELGDQLPFERPECYLARRKKDRLPVGLLGEYAAALELRPFEASFYAPAGWGTIVTREGWRPPGTRDVSLDDVQERLWTPADERKWPW